METSTNLGRVSLVPRGEYDPAAQYERLDIVRYNGSSYLVLRPAQGVTPVNGADYMLVAEKGGQGNKGDRGEAAGFGAVSAAVDDSSGTPSVEVSVSGPDTAKAFAFSFHGLKGKQGVQGEKGDPGSNIASIERTSGTGAPGTRDTYTITLTDGSTTTFQVYNGADGVGAGDMTAAIYDPQGKAQDIFQYVDDHTQPDAVTVPSGGVIEMGEGLGEGPYAFEFEEDGEGSAGRADQVSYDGAASGLEAETVQGAIDTLAAQKADASRVSNPNMLINWYFLDPINRRGQMEYNALGYTIDRWYLAEGGTLKVVDNGIQINWTTTNFNRNNVFQLLKYPLEENTVYTLSVVADGILYTYSHIPYVNAVCPIPNFGYCRLYNTQSGGGTRGIVEFVCNVGDNTATIEAVKLELGPVQTLAHQDAEGNWVLNDPPNYDLQYALCSQYSPAAGEWIGYQHSNPNMLDNPNFQINQRNITSVEYSGAVIKTVDRWEAWRYDVKVTPDGVSTAEHTDGTSGWFRQLLDISLAGKDVTFSALIDGDLHSVTALSYKSDIYSDWKDNARLSIGYSESTGLYAAVIYNNTAAPKVIQAAKLELGSVQTLAHKEGNTWVLNDPPPDPALELAKCQRYLVVFGQYNIFFKSSTGNEHIVQLPGPMRGNPVIIKTENIPLTNPHIAWYNANTNQLLLRGDNTISLDDIMISGPVYFSCEP